MRERIAKRGDNLKTYVKTCLEVAGVDKLAAGTFSLRIQNNPASVDIFQPELIPDLYMRTPEPKPPVAVPDKKLIKQAIDDGFEVQGARLVTSTRLVIK